jgi:uncharacterized membrane protein
MAKITVARAVSAHIARRIIRLVSVIAAVVLAVLLIITWALAHFFSTWWWLLLIPVFILLVVFLVIRFILSFIVRKIHVGNLNQEQKSALDDFTDKLERLIEARGTPPIFFVLLSVKDLLIYRDIKTLKELVRDSTSLKRDYESMERLF